MNVYTLYVKYTYSMFVWSAGAYCTVCCAVQYNSNTPFFFFLPVIAGSAELYFKALINDSCIAVSVA